MNIRGIHHNNVQGSNNNTSSYHSITDSLHKTHCTGHSIVLSEKVKKSRYDLYTDMLLLLEEQMQQCCRIYFLYPSCPLCFVLVIRMWSVHICSTSYKTDKARPGPEMRWSSVRTLQWARIMQATTCENESAPEKRNVQTKSSQSWKMAMIYEPHIVPFLFHNENFQQKKVKRMHMILA